MNRFAAFFLVVGLCACRTVSENPGKGEATSAKMERVVISPEGRGFVLEQSGRPFHPWGMNYGNAGRLMEDFWHEDWETFAADFREMKALGANVVRVHLQYGKFMDAPDRPNVGSFKQFQRLLQLAEETGIYLDVTGLACYRPGDTPEWYDALDEPARWAAQAKFWELVAKEGASSPAVFCYDLINEPVSPAQPRKPGEWRSGHLFGGYDFLQYIALDPAGRARDEIARDWIRQMSAAIRKHDQRTLITVGLLPWSYKWKHLSGFLPETIAPELDFISVHIYPEKEQPDAAMECLRQFTVGKPVVIEETFPLRCDIEQLAAFLRDSREIACGWIGHFDGLTIEQIDALERANEMKISQAIYRSWLRMFVRLKPEFVEAENPGDLR